jgi:hypothetical protein
METIYEKQWGVFQNILPSAAKHREKLKYFTENVLRRNKRNSLSHTHNSLQ